MWGTDTTKWNFLHHSFIPLKDIWHKMPFFLSLSLTNTLELFSLKVKESEEQEDYENFSASKCLLNPLEGQYILELLLA